VPRLAPSGKQRRRCRSRRARRSRRLGAAAGAPRPAVGAAGRRPPGSVRRIAGPPAIRLVEVRKRFPGAADDAVSGLSLDLEEGSFTALLGPSGCGKTTTLRMINRLVEPSSGTIELFGRDVGSVPGPELRRGIGYVIQQGGLFPHRTVAANIATVPGLLGWDKRRIRDRVEELVDLVGLDRAILGRYPAALSGGQRQRVGVARALAADPPVMLMDEPYSAVDPVVRARLQDELLLLQRKVRKTVVLVTHDVEEAVKLADRIALLDVGGVLLQCGTPDELLRDPADERVAAFLGRERALRRLGLVTVGELRLSPEVDPADRLPIVATAATAREALDLLVATGAPALAVAGADGVVVGRVDLAVISASVGRSPA